MSMLSTYTHTEKPLIKLCSMKWTRRSHSKAYHHVAEKDKYQEDGCQPARGGSNLEATGQSIVVPPISRTLLGLAFPEIALKQLDNTIDSANMHRMD